MGENGTGNGKRADGPPDEEAHVEKPEAEATGSEQSEPEAEATGPERPRAEAPPPRKGAAWGEPLARFDRGWTWLESRLLTFVLVWQIVSLVSWVFLNGLSESVTTTAGIVFRAVLLAILFGLGAWLGLRKQGEEKRRNLTLLAIALGIGLIVLWSKAATPAAAQKATGSTALALDTATAGYFDNIKGWLQGASTLTLLGGLRGLATRLTLWLALLGGSLATAAGKHIHVDVVFRFLPRKARVPVTILNYVAASAVCFAGVWGFFDHIAIESYGSNAADRASVKIQNAVHHVGDHAFLTRKQIGLDLRSLPRVLAGKRWDWMNAEQWNTWLDGAGFESRWDAERVKGLRVPADATHAPFVVSPDGENAQGMLAHTLGLVFPFGLLAIALRFLLRALLTLSGHVEADPDEAHKEEIGQAAEGGA